MHFGTENAKLHSTAASIIWLAGILGPASAASMSDETKEKTNVGSDIHLNDLLGQSGQLTRNLSEVKSNGIGRTDERIYEFGR